MENNSMISFGSLITECFNNYDVYIPLLQRNYKWKEDTAVQLAKDLWDSYEKGKTKYTAGMITLYEEKGKGKMQIIDGQQRMVTLFMILKYLMPEDTYFRFRFERDDGIKDDERKRFNFLDNIGKINESGEYTDLRRFRDNYIAIKEVLDQKITLEGEKEKFKKYIFDSLYLLLHISDVEPFDEFINLNNNKTSFVISDRIKANLIMDSDERGRREVLDMFRDLSNMLYFGENNVVWDLVSKKYIEKNIPNEEQERGKDKLYTDENRLKLLCCERYNNSSSIVGYERENEYQVLTKYKNILNRLKEDAKEKDWSSYNGFRVINNEGMKFFELLAKYASDNFEYIEKYYEAYLKEKNEEKKFFIISCFIEIQLRLGNTDVIEEFIEEFNSVKSDFQDSEGWVNTGIDLFNEFIQIYDIYIGGKYNGQKSN